MFVTTGVIGRRVGEGVRVIAVAVLVGNGVLVGTGVVRVGVRVGVLVVVGEGVSVGVGIGVSVDIGVGADVAVSRGVGSVVDCNGAAAISGLIKKSTNATIPITMNRRNGAVFLFILSSHPKPEERTYGGHKVSSGAGLLAHA